MVVCAPCLIPIVKAGAVGLTGAFTYSKVRDRKYSKRLGKKKKKTVGKKKKTKGRGKKKKSQRGGSGMTDTGGEYDDWISNLSRQDSDEENELQEKCEYHLREGIKNSKRKNIPYNVNDLVHIKNMCRENKSSCYKCKEFMDVTDLMPTQEKDESVKPIKYLPPPVPLSARSLNMNKKLSDRNSMLFTAASNRKRTKKLKKSRRSKHLREAVNRNKKRKSDRRSLRRTQSASFGGGGKIKYGIRKNKVIKLYPHKIKTKIGRHNYKLLWKTTKNNLPGKTFHGTFYNSKEEAMKNIN